MKLQKQNVIYRVEDIEEIQFLKSQGFKEVRPKSKLEIESKEEKPSKPNKVK